MSGSRPLPPWLRWPFFADAHRRLERDLRAWRDREHSHEHVHSDGTRHRHTHAHHTRDEHLHVPSAIEVTELASGSPAFKLGGATVVSCGV